MALFGRKKAVEAEVVEEKVAPKKATKTTATKVTKAKKETKAKAEVSTDVKSETTNKLSYRITEKATNLSAKNVYVLNVEKTTNKTELKKELAKKYKVTVLGIRMINSPKKLKVSRGRLGFKGGGKKAYVTLKAGESIVL